MDTLNGSSKLLKTVDERTRIAGSNRMEILLFSLGGTETFGINVFKVREVTWTPPITRAPNLPPGVEGVISLRGCVIPVIGLAKFLGGDCDVSAQSTMMVTEFSRHTQGFLVHEVDRIVRVDWDAVRAPQGALSDDCSLVTALTELPDGKLVSILDVEQILANVFGETEVPPIEPAATEAASVLFADDSAIARKEIAQVLESLGVNYQHATTGLEAWERLQAMAASAQAEGAALKSRLSVILTDAEMPAMDGYVLTRKIKADARFKGIPVVMHSSLSSDANRAMGEHVGVDAYVPKFDPVVLADTLRPMLGAPAA